MWRVSPRSSGVPGGDTARNDHMKMGTPVCESCGLAPSPAASVADVCDKLMASLVRVTIDGWLTEAQRREVSFQLDTVRAMRDIFTQEAAHQRGKRKR
jgi:hypothetical protein